MKENVKETLDFGTMEVSRLFRKLFFPTLLGMVFSAVFVITDGIFVGRGIGSDALAAVNITAPLFLINTGIGLMFGVGASVAASIALSRGRERLARAYITQSVYVGSLLLILLWGIVLCFSPQVARFFGSSERLLPLALEYMHWFLPFFVFSALLNSGMFFVRLDGSPRYAMLCNVVPALINIALDYWFIFGLGWGMMGAALATSLGYILGALMIVGYLLRPTITLRLMSLQRTRSGWRQLCRHTRTIMRLGLSSFLCEAAIATMMFVGNYVFMHYLYEDGVAAFSIACYFFPIIFMVYNAIAQSAQPILSYNHGCGARGRASGFAPGADYCRSRRSALSGGHRPVQSPDCPLVSRAPLSCLCSGRGGTAPVCLRLCILWREYCEHRLFSESGARPHGLAHHSVARFCLYCALLRAASSLVRCCRYLAGRTDGRVADVSFFGHRLLPPREMMAIFAGGKNHEKIR